MATSNDIKNRVIRYVINNSRQKKTILKTHEKLLNIISETAKNILTQEEKDFIEKYPNCYVKQCPEINTTCFMFQQDDWNWQLTDFVQHNLVFSDIYSVLKSGKLDESDLQPVLIHSYSYGWRMALPESKEGNYEERKKSFDKFSNRLYRVASTMSKAIEELHQVYSGLSKIFDSLTLKEIKILLPEVYKLYEISK